MSENQDTRARKFDFSDTSFELVPAASFPNLLDQPLEWSLKLWGEGKEEFTADDWHKFYRNVQSADYEKWDLSVDGKETLYLALSKNTQEVLAVIGLCDFDDLEEFRHLKPWLCAFVVREDLRGSGVGSKVLAAMEEKAKSFGIDVAYLWTEDQMPFYLKRGYQRIDELIKPGRTLHILKKGLTT
jgi:GNAT superfamily N-acetyltransferase